MELFRSFQKLLSNIAEDKRPDSVRWHCLPLCPVCKAFCSGSACAWWVVWRWPPLSKPVGAYCLPERTGACSFVSASCLGTEETMFWRKHGRVGGRFRFSSTSLHIYLLILRWVLTAQVGLKLKLTMQGSWSSRSQQLSCLSLQMLDLQAWCLVVFSMLIISLIGWLYDAGNKTQGLLEATPVFFSFFFFYKIH